MSRKGPKGLVNPHERRGLPRIKGRNSAKSGQTYEQAMKAIGLAAVKRKRRAEKRLAPFLSKLQELQPADLSFADRLAIALHKPPTHFQPDR